MKHQITPLSIELQIFAKRARFYNDVVGALSVSLAFGALGTDAPRFYALLGMAFALVLMARYGKQYERVYALWREIDHPLTQFRFVWKSFLVVLVGWSFLGLVAMGVLNKSGLVGL
jgi:hypothetical protein